MKERELKGEKVNTLFQGQLDEGKKIKKVKITSGCIALDKVIGGYSSGELIVVGGRFAMGKTKFLLKSVLEMSKTQNVLYCSLELSKRQLLNRIIGLKIDNGKKFFKDYLTLLEDDEKEKMKEELKGHKLLLTSKRFENIWEFISLCNYHIANHQVKVIVVDYIQLFPDKKNDKEIVNLLVQLTEDLNIVLVVASQLSRKVEKRGGDRKPILSDLRYNVNLQNKADKVLMLYRPEYYGVLHDENGNSNKGKMDIIIMKDNEYAFGEVRVDF